MKVFSRWAESVLALGKFLLEASAIAALCALAVFAISYVVPSSAFFTKGEDALAHSIVLGTKTFLVVLILLCQFRVLSALLKLDIVRELMREYRSHFKGLLLIVALAIVLPAVGVLLYTALAHRS